jgi:hypothetical protein
MRWPHACAERQPISTFLIKCLIGRGERRAPLPACEALECGSLLPLSFPRACSREFERVRNSRAASWRAKIEACGQPASWLAKKRQ